MYAIEDGWRYVAEHRVELDEAFKVQCRGMTDDQLRFVVASGGKTAFDAMAWLVSSLSKAGASTTFVGKVVAEFLAMTTPRPRRPVSEPFALAVRIIERTRSQMAAHN